MNGFHVVVGFPCIFAGLALFFYCMTVEDKDWVEFAKKVKPRPLNSHPSKGLVAVDSQGFVLMPAGTLSDGSPLWMGTFDWRNLSAYVVMFRSWRSNTVVELIDG